MKQLLLLVLLIFIIPFSLADIVITEILYDPDGADTGREWVELYNNGPAQIDITGWKFKEAGSNHGLSLEQGSLTVAPGDFMIIVQNTTKFLIDNPDYGGNIVKSSFSLNTGEELSILDSGASTLDSLTYTNLASGGHSIEVLDPGLDNSDMNNWVEGRLNGNPGNVMQNEEVPQENPPENNEEENNEEETNENQENETQETNENTEEPANEDCEIFLSIDSEKQIFNSDEKIEFSHKLTDKSYTFKITYWVEDLSGKIIKEKVTTQNTNKKSFMPKIDASEKAFIIKSNLDEIKCNNKNKITEAEKIVIVKNTKEAAEKLKESTIYIEKTDDTEFQNGILKADLLIYKGGTDKYSIKAYIERKGAKISEITSFNLKTKHQPYQLTIPIILKNICEESTEESLLIIEGLDIRAEKSLGIINAGGKNCGPEGEKNNEKAPEYELLFFSQSVSENEHFSFIKIANLNNKTHNYSISSLIYKGSKTFSKEKEPIWLELEKGSSGTIFLKNSFLDTSSGKYNFKILIKRDDEKTEEITKEITLLKDIKTNQEIEIIEKTQSTSVSAAYDNKETEEDSQIEQKEENEITGKIIYESPSEKAKNYSKYLLILVLAITGIILYKLKSS